MLHKARSRVVLGQALEAKAKGQTSKAIEKLLAVLEDHQAAVGHGDHIDHGATGRESWPLNLTHVVER